MIKFRQIRSNKRRNNCAAASSEGDDPGWNDKNVLRVIITKTSWNVLNDLTFPKQLFHVFNLLNLTFSFYFKFKSFRYNFFVSTIILVLNAACSLLTALSLQSKILLIKVLVHSVDREFIYMIFFYDEMKCYYSNCIIEY